jgi:DNA-binding LytR/AlgR family response regulator
MYRAPLSNILYFESYGRKVRIVRNGGSSEFYGRLSDIASKYSEKGFIQIHKSYVVNLHYIKSVNRTQCVLSDNTVIPVSKTYYSILLNRLAYNRNEKAA